VGNRAAQHVCYRPNLLRSVPGRIDDCLEAAAPKRGEIPVAIAAQLFDLGKEVRVPPAAVEQDDFMPSRNRGFDNVPTEEERAAEDQDSHAVGSRVEGVSVSTLCMVAAI
jgi:hypothetical protein